MKLRKDELQILINVVGNVNVPIASKNAEVLRGLINKMSLMIDEILSEKNKSGKKK